MTDQSVSVQIRIPQDKVSRLEDVLADWLERLTNELSRKMESNVPESDLEEVEVRAHTVGDFVRSVIGGTQNGGDFIISHDTENPDVLNEELSRLYVEFSYRDRPEARQRVRDEPIKNVVELVAEEVEVE